MSDRRHSKVSGALALALVASLGVAGCAAKKTKLTPVVSVDPQTNADIWKGIASPADVSRIERVGIAWASALTDARKSNRSDVAAERELLVPRAALPRPAPTPGSYYCRLVRLGRTTTKVRAFEKFKPFFCYVEVEDRLLTIVKQTGSERPSGRLWEDDRNDRLVFLGTVAHADEKDPPGYGEDAKRDVAGVLERVAPFRWRLVIPWPQGTSKLDIYELKPVTDQP